MPLTVVILAAGQGKRMASDLPKVLQPLAGRPLLAHVVDTARSLEPGSIHIVHGHGAEQVRAAITGADVRWVLQAEQKGTGHALVQAMPGIPDDHTVLVLYGDVPLLRAATLADLVARAGPKSLALLSARLADPTGYGRVVRDTAGRVARIVEHKDADRALRTLREINCGIYAADPKTLFPLLARLKPDNAQGEYYLTDAVHRTIERRAMVAALVHGDAPEVLGVNTRAELARAGASLYARKAEELQDQGVTILDPSRTWIDPRARIGQDTVVYPDVIVEGPSTVGADCVIRSGTRLTDVVLGRGVTVKDHCVLRESRVGDGAEIGPFAHFRPGAVLDDGSKVGNFVELKKTRLGRGSKASHLAYLGDAEIGPGCNIGAGTITCNYDGTAKHKTTLGPGVFIGSDTQLVAPVHVGEGAYVGAGTTVTEDVPAGALAISRVRQLNLEGWVARRKAKAAGKPGARS
jgi:bifunctional UDP-N-acetylglucosamine pyrophosphorylase/glucosamine-1-phosphate N-acetyltransferase